MRKVRRHIFSANALRTHRPTAGLTDRRAKGLSLIYIYREMRDADVEIYLYLVNADGRTDGQNEGYTLL